MHTPQRQSAALDFRYARCHVAHRPLADTAAVVSASDASPIGLSGRIVVATRGPDGAGEVEVRIRGGTEAFIARSTDPLPVGQPVIVLSTLGPRTVIVAPWADPIESLLEL